MTLSVPYYIAEAGVQDNRIQFNWDDWNVEAVDLPVDDVLQKRLQAISHRAIAAFTIATAEWILHRFAVLSNVSLPRSYLEAAWAQIVHFRYAVHHDVDMQKWRGPVQGPVGVAIRRVKFAVLHAENVTDPVTRAGRISRLAEHVINEPTAFLDWQTRTLNRLGVLYPMDSDELLGDVVPREVFDPGYDFCIDDTEALVKRFLISLDWKANRFLNSPDQMIEQGFPGRPYEFDLEQDRAWRFNW